MKISESKIWLFCDGRIVPPNDGFSGHLARRFQIHKELGTDLSILLADRGWNDPALLANVGATVHLVSPKNYYSGGPKIRDLLEAAIPDAVIIPNDRIVLTTAPFLGQNTKLVYEVHELASQLTTQLGEKKRTASDRILELAAAKCADLVVTFTKNDRFELIKQGVESSRIVVRPCSPSIPAISGDICSDPNRLIFLGNGFYRPNHLGLKFIMERLLPHLPQNVTVSLVGTWPNAQSLTDNSRMRLLGPINDLASTLKAHAIGLCPIWHATGMRMKVLDYAAAGLVTVAAQPGAAGLVHTPGIIVAADENQFIAAILQLISQPLDCYQRQLAALEMAKNLDPVAMEANLFTRIFEIAPRSWQERVKICKASKVKWALATFPTPRWLEETIQNSRFK